MPSHLELAYSRCSMMLRQELACPRSSMVLDHLEEAVEVLQQQAHSASSRHWMASVPEDLEEGQSD